MDISIVIITWNQVRLLEQCVESVLGNAIRSRSQLIIIDNGSTDRTMDYLDSLQNVQIVRNLRNLGVSKARNQGIRKARGRYILHLDDDTWMHDGCIDNMVDFMDRHPDVWLAGGRLVNPDGTLQPSTRTFYTPWAILARRTPWGRTRKGKEAESEHLMQWWDHNDSRTVDWVCGACFCMRREAVGTIGMLDDGYFFGVEDVDWAFRVWQAGGTVAYVHDSVVTHHYQRSSKRLLSRKAMSHLASLMRFHLKNGFRYPHRPHQGGEPAILK